MTDIQHHCLPVWMLMTIFLIRNNITNTVPVLYSTWKPIDSSNYVIQVERLRWNLLSILPYNLESLISLLDTSTQIQSLLAVRCPKSGSERVLGSNTPPDWGHPHHGSRLKARRSGKLTLPHAKHRRRQKQAHATPLRLRWTHILRQTHIGGWILIRLSK